uniref:Anti-sigma factor n=1 Tax=Acidobacterium capsulatum TaxID=33075 RepID=A0A7V4XTC1_9BACT
MNSCRDTRNSFSGYLDGALSGVEMQSIAAHLSSCTACAAEFESWRAMQDALYRLGPAKAPADLALRLRIAVSRERARTPRNWLADLRVRWENSLRPLVLQASAGFVSSVLLIGTVALMVGTLAAPPAAVASNDSSEAATAPRLLYSNAEGSGAFFNPSHAVVVEAYVDGQGQVYDYRIVAGPRDPSTRAAIENMLLFSIFQPAMMYGQPVRGVALISFSGVAVRG